MSAPTIPYVKTPLWVYRAREDGYITHDQFDFLCFAYYKANWSTRTVSTYSAENLCRFLGLDATEANLKRYQRAERDLERQGVVRDDYRRGDKRPYHLWLPPADTEDIESLYIHPRVADSVADSVGDATATTNTDSRQYNPPGRTDVRDDVGENGDMMSLKDQGEPSHPEGSERNPLNPLRGLDSPSVPPVGGKRSDAAGLSKPFTGKTTPNPADRTNPLKAEQCKQLEKAALLYADFSRWLYDFSPDVTHVEALLREFEPVEVIFAQMERFPLHIDRVNKNTMAQFFFKSAKAQIKAARAQDTSKSKPGWWLECERNKWPLPCRIGENGPEFEARWKTMVDAWKQIGIATE